MLEPARRLGQLIHGFWLSQAVYVAAKLELADLLASGPRGADELAAETRTQAGPLRRLLRALVSVFEQQEDGRFALNPTAEMLRRQAPGSQWALAVMMGEEQYQAYGSLLHSVQTGQPAFDHVFGQPIFDYLSQRPEQAAVFDAAMTGIHGRETAAMVEAFDFGQFGLIADIGGGNGGTLLGILNRAPLARGLLFDLPGVIERARASVVAAGMESRCQLVAGDFFASIPSGADAYLFRHIIHDWSEPQCLTILRNCRAAMSPHARLLIAESVIPPGNEPCFGKLLDLTMLAIPGGQERTEDEYRQLLGMAGFSLDRIVPTGTEISLLECRA